MLGACGRPLATALVDLGRPAIADIENALDSVGAKGAASPYAYRAGWLAMAYAKIVGPAAFPRLRRMKSGSPMHQNDLQTAIAIALGLTSYVDGASVQTTSCSPNDPRDGLEIRVLVPEPA
jgi:hypothetical protein